MGFLGGEGNCHWPPTTCKPQAGLGRAFPETAVPTVQRHFSLRGFVPSHTLPGRSPDGESKSMERCFNSFGRTSKFPPTKPAQTKTHRTKGKKICLPNLCHLYKSMPYLELLALLFKKNWSITCFCWKNHQEFSGFCRGKPTQSARSKLLNCYAYFSITSEADARRAKRLALTFQVSFASWCRPWWYWP